MKTLPQEHWIDSVDQSPVGLYLLSLKEVRGHLQIQSFFRPSWTNLKLWKMPFVFGVINMLISLLGCLTSRSAKSIFIYFRSNQLAGTSVLSMAD